MSGFGAFEALLSGSGRSEGIPPERLEMVGRRAATNYMDSGIPLNETVAKEAAALKGANSEHVRRMCEFANQDTFNAMFKAASGDSRVPNFEVADFNTVMQELGDGAASTQITPTDVSYATAPARYSKSAGAQFLEKQASAAAAARPKTITKSAFPLNDVMALRSKMATGKQQIDSEIGFLQSRERDARMQLVEKMAQAFREGHSAEELAVVCGSFDPRPQSMKLAGVLIGEAAKTARVRIGAMSPEVLTKLARVEVNPQSPVYYLFGSLLGVQEKMAARKLASQELGKRVDEATAFVRKVTSAT